jgi:MFS family permease
MTSSIVCSKLFVRTGTRPIIVAGSIVSAGAIFWLSHIPVDGSYLTDLLAPLFIMSIGLGGVFVGVQTAANAGVPADKAGLAAALVNTSFQLGAAFGLAVFSAIASSRTTDLLEAGSALPEALTFGFQRALVACSIFLVIAAVIGMKATNTRGEPVAGELGD